MSLVSSDGSRARREPDGGARPRVSGSRRRGRPQGGGATAAAAAGAALLLAWLGAGCSSSPSLPPYETPVSRAGTQRVRTTAYTHTEADHLAYSNHNALGGTLAGATAGARSAAADWSRWPAGTVFRLRNTGQLYRVDDYGWALAGTNTIDLYTPTAREMNAWGVQRVEIDVLRWGDARASYRVLHARRRFRHVARMVDELEGRHERMLALSSWERARLPVAVEPLLADPGSAPPAPPAVPGPLVAAAAGAVRPVSAPGDRLAASRPPAEVRRAAATATAATAAEVRPARPPAGPAAGAPRRVRTAPPAGPSTVIPPAAAPPAPASAGSPPALQPFLATPPAR